MQALMEWLFGRRHVYAIIQSHTNDRLFERLAFIFNSEEGAKKMVESLLESNPQDPTICYIVRKQFVLDLRR